VVFNAHFVHVTSVCAEAQFFICIHLIDHSSIIIPENKPLGPIVGTCPEGPGVGTGVVACCEGIQ
jgi:hypothetical protein